MEARHPDAPVELIEKVRRELACLLAEYPIRLIFGRMGVGRDVFIEMEEQLECPVEHVELIGERARLIDLADVVIVVGGSNSTDNEVRMALESGKPVFPIPCTRSAAKRCYDKLRDDHSTSVSGWLSDETLSTLGKLRSPKSIAKTVRSALDGLFQESEGA